MIKWFSCKMEVTFNFHAPNKPFGQASVLWRKRFGERYQEESGLNPVLNHLNAPEGGVFHCLNYELLKCTTKFWQKPIL